MSLDVVVFVTAMKTLFDRRIDPPLPWGAMTHPPPPPAGELRKVNVRYRCSVCGLEIKLTLAPDEDPPPPRHCLEDMEIVAPLYD